jgi:hypothetical protein
MPYPIAVVDGTDNTVISYFSGAVPVDPNVTVVVNLNGYTSNVIDMGPRGNTDGAGVNVRVDVQKLNGLNQVQFFIETSDNGIDGWNLCAADDTVAFVTGPVELLIHFETDRRFFRLAWSGQDAPDAELSPAVMPLWIEIPMQPPPGSYQAITAPTPYTNSVSTTYQSGSGTTDTVALTIRGIVELKGTTGGSVVPGSGGRAKVGATLDDNSNNIFELVISAPAATVVLNCGTAGVDSDCVILDYTGEFSITDGATVTLSANSVDDGSNYSQGPFAVPTGFTPPSGVNVPPDDGEYLQVDGFPEVYSTLPNYPAGNYALSYLFGCFNFGPLPSEAGSWSIQTNVTNGTTVEGYAPFGVPPPPYELHNPWNFSEATEQAYWAGLLLPFTHAGGPIGVQCGDPFTGDNTEGSPPTTWALRSETEVTFSWSYAVSNRGL